MNLHSLILPAVLAAGLGSIYMLPTTGASAPSAISMALPETVGDWTLTTFPASKIEQDVLGKDTLFSKAACLQPRPGEFFSNGKEVPDRIDLSIVLSGHDLNTSIHRPERCMPAQGHDILSTSTVPIRLANGRSISVRRLKSTQTIVNPEDRTQEQRFDCITYYFFVGHERIEHDHYGRTFADMKDRLVRGMDQRWAYVTISTWFGKVPWIEAPVPEAEADAKLAEFTARFAEGQIDWEQMQ